MCGLELTVEAPSTMVHCALTDWPMTDHLYTEATIARNTGHARHVLKKKKNIPNLKVIISWPGTVGATVVVSGAVVVIPRRASRKPKPHLSWATGLAEVRARKGSRMMRSILRPTEGVGRREPYDAAVTNLHLNIWQDIHLFQSRRALWMWQKVATFQKYVWINNGDTCVLQWPYCIV